MRNGDKAAGEWGPWACDLDTRRIGGKPWAPANRILGERTMEKRGTE